MLCLAVVHHLALTNTVPLDEIVAFLADFGATLVVEFPHDDDPMAARLLARKRAGVFDAYHRANWERALATHFDVHATETLPGGTRTLYHCSPPEGLAHLSRGLRLGCGGTMILLLALHLVVGTGLMAATRSLAGRRLPFLLAGVPLLATWCGSPPLPGVGGGDVVTETVEWIPQLGVDLALRLDGFAALMLVLVAGIGVLVVVYSAATSPPRRRGTSACWACSSSSPGR